MDRRELLKLLAGMISSGTALGRLEEMELRSLSGQEQEELEELLDDTAEEDESDTCSSPSEMDCDCSSESSLPSEASSFRCEDR